jgi:hypothetical protein
MRTLVAMRMNESMNFSYGESSLPVKFCAPTTEDLSVCLIHVLFDAPDSIVLECVEVSYVIHSIFVLFWRL